MTPCINLYSTRGRCFALVIKSPQLAAQLLRHVNVRRNFTRMDVHVVLALLVTRPQLAAQILRHATHSVGLDFTLMGRDVSIVVVTQLLWLEVSNQKIVPVRRVFIRAPPE